MYYTYECFVLYGKTVIAMNTEIAQMIASNDKIVGTKQVIKGIAEHTVRCVIVADDADRFILDRICDAAVRQNIRVLHCPSMDELGKACGIEVAAAACAIKA